MSELSEKLSGAGIFSFREECDLLLFDLYHFTKFKNRTLLSHFSGSAILWYCSANER
jgi:hypothetical protein